MFVALEAAYILALIDGYVIPSLKSGIGAETFKIYAMAEIK